MRLLLDTYIAIWAISRPERLGPRGRALIGDETNDVFVSAVSIWEIAIKYALRGRATAPPFSGAEAVSNFETVGYRLLPITARHAAAIETLPPIHADPFDRLLVAQALTEPLRLVTADEVVARYSDMIVRMP